MSLNFNCYRRAQSGAILVITLVILVAMTLSAVGLMRSVDTAQLLSGNIGFKRDVINRAMIGLKGISKQMTKSDFSDISKDYCQSCAVGTNDRNYSPRMLETNSLGIPTVLTNTTLFASTYSTDTNAIADSAAYVTTRYLIERMCSDYGTPSSSSCLLDNVSPEGGSTGLDFGSPGAPASPLFRVTVRADGPRNTVGYAQAIVSINQ